MLALLAVSRVDAQQPPDFSADRFKAHVTFLADDLLEGREAGTRGYEIAGRYIATQFQLLGVRPGARDGSYYEQVGLLESSNTGAPPTVTITGPTGTTSLADKKDALVVGSLSGGAQISAPLVFAGYGVVDRALGIDDYSGLDVRGKIVVAFRAPMTGIDSEVAAHLLSEQRRVASEHGAIGVVALRTRRIERVLPWQLALQYGDTTVTTWIHTDGTPEDPLFGMKAAVGVGPDAAPALFEGAGTTLDEVLDEADKPGGRPKGFPLATTLSVRTTTSVRRYSSPDVVGIIDGSDPALKNEYVALMAHADHLGISGSGPDRINNGALDNAAGVATLLEVARALTMSGARPKRSVLIVANTAEEKGLLGAEALANHPPVPIDRIVAAVDLDMPLLLYDFTDVVAYGGTHSTLDQAFRAAGAEMGISLSPDPMPEQATFVRSDHYAMAKAGVPAVMLATGMANGGEAAWKRFLTTQYHHPNDDLSQPIHWQSGARFAELNYRAVRILADATEAPRWYAGDYFGNLFAPNKAKAARP